jgi:hypothetical protein
MIAGYLVAMLLFMMIVDRAGSPARYRADCRTGPASGKRTDGRAAGRTDSDPFYRSANVMTSAINGTMAVSIISISRNGGCQCCHRQQSSCKK